MSKRKTTTDVWFAAFLQKHGHPLDSFSVRSRGKAEFSFLIEDKLWETLKLEFHNSELSEFKSLISQLKDLAY